MQELDPQLLQQHAADLDLKDITMGWTALHYAAAAHNVTAAEQVRCLNNTLHFTTAVEQCTIIFQSSTEKDFNNAFLHNLTEHNTTTTLHINSEAQNSRVLQQGISYPSWKCSPLVCCMCCAGERGRICPPALNYGWDCTARTQHQSSTACVYHACGQLMASHTPLVLLLTARLLLRSCCLLVHAVRAESPAAAASRCIAVGHSRPLGASAPAPGSNQRC